MDTDQKRCHEGSDRFLRRLDQLCRIGLDRKGSLCGLPILRMHLRGVSRVIDDTYTMLTLIKVLAWVGIAEGTQDVSRERHALGGQADVVQVVFFAMSGLGVTAVAVLDG